MEKKEEPNEPRAFFQAGKIRVVAWWTPGINREEARELARLVRVHGVHSASYARLLEEAIARAEWEKSG